MHVLLVDHLIKTKIEYKNLKKKKIQDITNRDFKDLLGRPAWVSQYVIKQLMLLKIQAMMDNK